MKIGILTIGNELTSGRIQDTNSALIARAVKEQGWPVAAMLSVGDDDGAIHDALDFLLARAEADALHKPRRDPLSRLGGMMSSRPDTSATRRGPVRLGAPPPTEPQVAATGTLGTASVAVESVGDASLSTGKPVDVKPATNDPSIQATSTEKEARSTATKGSDSADTPTSKKKKKSLFKRIIKPF